MLKMYSTKVKRAAELLNIVPTAKMEAVCMNLLSLEWSDGDDENITERFTRYAIA